MCNHIVVKKSYMDNRTTHAGHRKANGEFTVADVSKKTTRIKRNVWDYKTSGGLSTTDKNAHNHSAIFPEALAQDHILSWSNPDDLVLDCFAGSGTTLKKAKELGRRYIGIEISKEYCDLIEKRVLATNPPLFVS